MARRLRKAFFSVVAGAIALCLLMLAVPEILSLNAYGSGSSDASQLDDEFIDSQKRLSQQPEAPNMDVLASTDWSIGALEHMDDMQWQILDDAANGTYRGPPEGGAHHACHWVIFACNGSSWARMLSHTLLSAWADGFNPISTTVIWCEPYNETLLPSLFFNLRHSAVDVVFLPQNITQNNQSHALTALHTALSIPAYHGTPDVPLLLTEHDVFLAPHMNERLSKVILEANLLSKAKPYFLNLYHFGDMILPSHSLLDLYDVHEEPVEHQSVKLHSFVMGPQAFLLSPILTKRLQEHVAQNTTLYDNRQLFLMDFLYTHMNCIDSEHVLLQYAECFILRAVPSLAQHTGIVAGEDDHQHMSWDFPFKIRLPGLDTRSW